MISQFLTGRSFREREYTVKKTENGIYQVQGDIIPIQIIVTKELTKEENLWLKSLTNRLEKSDAIEELLDSYKNNYKNPLYKSVMNLIIRANQEMFEEVRDMCEALEELMKDKIEERAEERAKVIAEEQVNIAEKKIVNLMAALLKQGRSEDIIRAAEDDEYHEQLLKEFGL